MYLVASYMHMYVCQNSCLHNLVNGRGITSAVLHYIMIVSYIHAA